MTRADKLLLVAILLAALGIAAWGWMRPGRGKPLQAVVRVQGEVVRTLPLAGGANTVYTIAGRLGTAHLDVANGRVRVLDAPCPNQICVRQGWIAHPGESLVCVPGEMVVEIEGVAPLDAVTR